MCWIIAQLKLKSLESVSDIIKLRVESLSIYFYTHLDHSWIAVCSFKVFLSLFGTWRARNIVRWINKSWLLGGVNGGNSINFHLRRTCYDFFWKRGRKNKTTTSARIAFASDHVISAIVSYMDTGRVWVTLSFNFTFQSRDKSIAVCSILNHASCNRFDNNEYERSWCETFFCWIWIRQDLRHSQRRTIDQLSARLTRDNRCKLRKRFITLLNGAVSVLMKNNGDKTTAKLSS